ncbi:MAG: hypothetical protein VX498_14540, partial [Myxococcota bacterium]|nr:hypothetical protein [Myxococcota bacterium]
FFLPAVEDLPHPLSEPLELLSTEGIANAYDRLLERLGQVLKKRDGTPDDLFGLARRFGTRSETAQKFSEQLAEVAAGRRNGLPILPLMQPPGQQNDLVCFVPLAGRLGRVGCSFDESDFLPEHSDDYSFEGIEGWLLALVRSRGCHRVLFT